MVAALRELVGHRVAQGADLGDGHLDDVARELAPKSRAVLLMHYQQGLTLVEVAQVLGLSVGTVKSRLSYGLGVLRKRLALAAPGAPSAPSANGASGGT